MRNIERIRTINMIFFHTSFIFILFIHINLFRHYIFIHSLIFVHLNNTFKNFNHIQTTPNHTIHISSHKN